MSRNYFFDQIQILVSSKQSVVQDSVLIHNGIIKAFGKQALTLANELGIKPSNGNHKLLAPCFWANRNSVKDSVSP